MRLEGLDHVALFVLDVPRSAAWYRKVLGLERRYAETWGDHPIVMAAGGSGVALFPATATSAPPPDSPPRAPRLFAHVAFRTTAGGLEEPMGELRGQGVAFTTQDHHIARGIDLRDPDRHEWS